VKSRGSQCNETLLVRAAVRPGKKRGLQSAAKNLQWRIWMVLAEIESSRKLAKPNFGGKWPLKCVWLVLCLCLTVYMLLGLISAASAHWHQPRVERSSFRTEKHGHQ